MMERGETWPSARTEGGTQSQPDEITRERKGDRIGAHARSVQSAGVHAPLRAQHRGARSVSRILGGSTLHSRRSILMVQQCPQPEFPMVDSPKSSVRPLADTTKAARDTPAMNCTDSSRTVDSKSVGGSDKWKRASRGLSVKVTPLLVPSHQAMSKLLEKLEIKFFSGMDDTYRQNWFKAAESGDLQEFETLYFYDPSRLKYRDSKGKTALHHAAAQNRVEIVQFVLDHGGDINVQDDAGNTPLHLAVENDCLDTMSLLMMLGADTSILNNDSQGAIHIATALNRVRILEEMVKHKGKVNTNLRGKHGRTALHLAAIYDNADCARILLSQLACCPRTHCDNGYYPIHEAAKNASANALRAILEWGESMGYPREEMMKIPDADGNVPLHSAVHAGDIKAVQLCLQSGAIISTQQHNLSTPVHLACAQGAIDIVKLMFVSQPQEKFRCLNTCDAQEMTPLHCAAMFDHPELVEYLVLEGADMHKADKEGRSVLLLAAARGAWNSVTCLLRLGTKICTRDKYNRNILHHIVISGGSVEDFCCEISERGTEILELLNDRDVYGCTPMHYASKDGHLKTIQSLLRLGAVVNLKNNENQSPLHFAARYGRYNTVRHLLESKKGHLIINEMDGEGLTPLHIASQNGHTRVVHLLLVKGALLHRDHKGRTPLHYAAENGYTHTMEQLLTVHSHLLDQTDRDGNTALHMSAINNRANAASLLLTLNCKILPNNQDMTALDYALDLKHSDVTVAIVLHPTRSEEVMKLKTKKYTCLLEGLTASMPEVMMAVLDKGITRSSASQDCKSYYVRYNFEYLQETSKICDIVPVNHTPLPIMNMMVRYGKEELLSHPLCGKYLETKWNSYGMYFHLLNLGVYTVFLMFLTVSAIQLVWYDSYQPLVFEPYNRTAPALDIIPVAAKNRQTSKAVMATVVLVFVVLNILKEFYQMFQQKARYFLDPINSVEWTLYISSGLMGLGHLFPDQLLDPSHIHIMAAIAVFLAWFNYLLYLQRFNRIGIYIVMFLEILSTLLKVMSVFSVLLIAFGLSFYILLNDIPDLTDKGFGSLSISFLRVGTMMLGEMDFLGTFLRPLMTTPEAFWHQIAAATWFLGAFAVLMPILLMNLLIGLAVGDIETVRRNAQLKRLTMQVELHTDLERKLPRRLLKWVDKTEVYEYPNKACQSSYLWKALSSCFASPNSPAKPSCRDRARARSYERPSERSESAKTDVYQELHKQRKRLREMAKNMELQLQLLRLIVQKMEIRAETDDLDDSISDVDDADPDDHLPRRNQWSSASVRGRTGHRDAPYPTFKEHN